MTIAQKIEVLAKIAAEQSLANLRIGLLLILDEVEEQQRNRPYPSQHKDIPTNA